MLTRTMVLILSLVFVGLAHSPAQEGTPPVGKIKANPDSKIEYKLLATNKTSTMEKELNDTAAQGFVYGGVMGGETAFGGSETVVIMVKDPMKSVHSDIRYKLLATSKTSTMQKELQQAGNEGFEYKGQTVFS